MRYMVICLLIIALSNACSHDEQSNLKPSHLQQYCVQRLTDVIVYDIFSPPVASRIYAYSNLAWYEALRHSNTNSKSIIAKLHGFETLHYTADTSLVNYELAAAHAFFTTAKSLIFSKDSITITQSFIEDIFRKENSKVIFQKSISFGDSVAAIILRRAATDHYKETRGMPRYSVFKETGKWQQTPPDYADAAEPYWMLIEPLLPDSAGQLKPLPPPPYNEALGSVYQKQLEEIFAMSKRITPQMDTIAHYWDDNPFVTEHEGHFTFATKKTTPAGHWMGITQILSQQQDADPIKTATCYALTSAAIFDGFILCWHEKYTSRTVRPVTVIRALNDPNWNPLLQTPPFPEYISGHSVISSAAAGVLTFMLGQVAFVDTTEMKYLGLSRRFTSVKQAANEVSISRMYGGIHYRAAVEAGAIQGEKIAALYGDNFGFFRK